MFLEFIFIFLNFSFTVKSSKNTYNFFKYLTINGLLCCLSKKKRNTVFILCELILCIREIYTSQ